MTEAVPQAPAGQTPHVGSGLAGPEFAHGLALRVAGLALVVLGAVTLAGWIARWPPLTDLRSMVMTTALMFVASGLALMALARSQRHVAGLIGSGVGILALVVLIEHWLDVDLGVNLAFAQAWAPDGFPHPGRPARATALCFALASAGLALLGMRPRTWTSRLVAVLSLLVLLISLRSGFGKLLSLDTLYPSFGQRGMAVQTAMGLFLLGTCLLWTTLRERLLDQVNGDDTRIVSVGSLLLALVALATGLPILYVVRSQVENAMSAGLNTALNTQVQFVDSVLKLRTQRAAIIVDRPDAIGALRALNHEPTDAAALRSLQTTIESFRPHGFSALRVTLANGNILATSGEFVTEPQLIAPISPTSSHRLLWRDGYYLRSHFEVRDGNSLLATLDTEQMVPQIAAAFPSVRGLGTTGELQICQRSGDAIHCFPGAEGDRPMEKAPAEAPDPRLLQRAAAGGSGTFRGRDSRGHQVIGAYAPITPYGLFGVIKIDAAELYGPLRRNLELALGLATLTIFVGSMLFRIPVKPIATEIVRTRKASLDKSRAMERLHTFQRAVFEQAPDGILVADQEGRIVEANERMAELFGYEREILHSKRIEDLVPQRVRAEHHHHRATFQQTPSTRAMSRDRTLHGQRADGTEFPIEVALAPMITPEGRRVIAIVKDVSEARRFEQVIRESLKEKELLLGEIHHRVKNNLQIVQSLLDMQAGLTTDERAANALRDSQNRVQSMALIHQTLYQSHNFAEVEFGRFLETLMTHLQSSYGRRDLILSSRADPISLSIERAIPCGLVVNELVTNALKHAFPDGRSGGVVVEMRLLQGVDVEVSVTDDGVGIPETIDLSTLSSLGMQLVQVLTEQLHAELHVQRRGPTRIAFTFPLN